MSGSHTTKFSTIEQKDGCFSYLLATAVPTVSSVSLPIKCREVTTLLGVTFWEVSSSTNAVKLSVTSSDLHPSTQGVGCSLIIKHSELDVSCSEFILATGGVIRGCLLSITEVIEHRYCWTIISRTLPSIIFHWVLLVQAKQIMAHVLQETIKSAVPQQGSVLPIFQGAIVGHMPDAQVLSLDVEVARVLVVITCGPLCSPKGVVVGPVAIPLWVVYSVALLTGPAIAHCALPLHVVLVHTGHQGPSTTSSGHVTEGLVDGTILCAEEVEAISCPSDLLLDFLAASELRGRHRIGPAVGVQVS